jgi:hypothetical protein
MKIMFALIVLMIVPMTSAAEPSLMGQIQCAEIVQGKQRTATLTNAELKAVIDLQESPFDFQKEPGHTAIWVLPKLTNLSKKPLSITVSAAFFDKVGNLVIALSQEWPKLDAGVKDFQLGSCIARLPVSDFRKIDTCKVTFLIGSPRKPNYSTSKEGEMIEKE